MARQRAQADVWGSPLARSACAWCALTPRARAPEGGGGEPFHVTGRRRRLVAADSDAWRRGGAGRADGAPQGRGEAHDSTQPRERVRVSTTKRSRAHNNETARPRRRDRRFVLPSVVRVVSRSLFVRRWSCRVRSRADPRAADRADDRVRHARVRAGRGRRRRTMAAPPLSPSPGQLSPLQPSPLRHPSRANWKTCQGEKQQSL